MKTNKGILHVLRVLLCTVLLTAVSGTMQVMAGSSPQAATPVALMAENHCVYEGEGKEQFYIFQTNDSTNYYSMTMSSAAGSNSVYYTVYSGADMSGKVALDYLVSTVETENGVMVLPKSTACLVKVFGLNDQTDTSFQITPIADDYGSTFQESTPVAAGTTVNGKIEVNGECDFFQFTTSNSDSYYQISVAATYPGTGVDTVLYNSADTTNEYDSFSTASSYTSDKIYKLEKNHTYYIKMRGGWDHISEYRFSIKEIQDNAGNDFSTATTIGLNKILKGQFENAKDVDFFKFKTSKKKAYQLTVKNKSESAMYVTVYYNDDIASRLSKVDSVYVPGASISSFQIDLNTSRNYYIKIYDGSAGSQYTVSIKDCQTAIKKAKPTSFNLTKYSGYSYLSWKNNNGYDGVEVYRSTSKSKGYKKIATVKNGTTTCSDYTVKSDIMVYIWWSVGTTTCSDYTVKSGKTYYYKLRYYVKDGNKTYYSKWTNIRSAKFSR